MPYRERLYPPPSWWLLALGLALSFALAAGYYLGPLWAVGAGGGTMIIAAALFFRAGVVISVDAEALRVGRARLEWPYAGACHPLDREATQRRSGPEADARAFLVLRPYVPTAVEIAVDDAIDPTPYWLISTRHPGRLAQAVGRARLDAPQAR